MITKIFMIPIIPKVRASKRVAGAASGFTLVELLIVVAIIAILAAIAIPHFQSYRLKAYKSEVDTDATNIYIASQAYIGGNPNETIDSLAKLETGGYVKSSNVTFVDGSMTTGGGNIEIYSTILKAKTLDNNAVIFGNGRIEQLNAP